MGRPVWSGVITFGLVTVPVQLFTATDSHTVHFHQLVRGTGDRVRNQRVNARTGKSVDADDIVKGYDLGEGEHVVVEPEELSDIAPGRSQVIEVSGFVELGEVEPVFFDRTYYLAPRGEAYTKVYDVLRASLLQSGKIGVATFVMRSKEYLVAVRAQENVLVLHTLHWADEVRDPGPELPALPGHSEATEKERKTAQQLIDSLTVPWQPEEFEDTYEQRVRELVEAKRNGEEIVTGEEPPEATNVVDLEQALRRSVEHARSGGRGTAGRRTAKGSGKKQKSGGGKRSGKASGSVDPAGLTKSELYERAAEQEVRGRSSMTREQLVEALGGPGRRRKAS